MDQKDKDLLDKHKTEVDKFREFCILYGDHAAFDESDFSDVSLGFFIALGITGDGGTGEMFFEAYHLSTICRYKLQYWQGETL